MIFCPLATLGRWWCTLATSLRRRGAKRWSMPRPRPLGVSTSWCVFVAGAGCALKNAMNARSQTLDRSYSAELPGRAAALPHLAYTAAHGSGHLWPIAGAEPCDGHVRGLGRACHGESRERCLGQRHGLGASQHWMQPSRPLCRCDANAWSQPSFFRPSPSPHRSASRKTLCEPEAHRPCPPANFMHPKMSPHT